MRPMMHPYQVLKRGDLERLSHRASTLKKFCKKLHFELEKGRAFLPVKDFMPYLHFERFRRLARFLEPHTKECLKSRWIEEQELIEIGRVLLILEFLMSCVCEKKR